MKKKIFFVVICLTGMTLHAQKVIEKPPYLAASSNSLVITRVELRDTCTILDCTVRQPGGQWISIPAETYIEPSVGGERLYVKSAEGVELIKQVPMPKEGVISYRLFFPGLDPAVTKIDYGEGGTPAGTPWFVYGITISKAVTAPVLPATVAGNWFTASGSRLWAYGLTDDAIICDSRVYFHPAISQDGELFKLTASNKEGQIVLYIKPSSGNLLIGTGKANLTEYSREPVFRPDYVFGNDEEFTLPVFTNDTAIYMGYVKNYSKKMGNPGNLVNENILSGIPEAIVLPMTEEGTFMVKIPVQYPHFANIRFFDTSYKVYLEPGKTTFQYLDQLGATDRSANPTSLYMGDGAWLNDDLSVTFRFINTALIDPGKPSPDKTPEEYKAWRLKIRDREMDSLNHFAKKYPVSKKAVQIRRMVVRFTYDQDILSYKMMPGPQSQEVKPDSTFYAFLTEEDLNNPLSLVTGTAYSRLVSIIRAMNENEPDPVELLVALADTVRKMGDKVSGADQAVVATLVDAIKNNHPEKVTQEFMEKWIDFNKRNPTLLQSVTAAAALKASRNGPGKGLRLEPGLLSDIITSQKKMTHLINDTNPLPETEEKVIRETIGTPFIANNLLAMNQRHKDQMAVTIKENKTKTGYTLNKTPKAKPEKLFEAITGKYKGKLVFVDFWATWCGPCRAGIERMKPLKEEYAGKDIVFVYITDPSSPQETFDLMIPDIKGQHYRLDAAQSKAIYERFKIKTIPRYMLIGKSGNIINDDLGAQAYTNEGLKKLFGEHLGK